MQRLSAPNQVAQGTTSHLFSPVAAFSVGCALMTANRLQPLVSLASPSCEIRPRWPLTRPLGSRLRKRQVPIGPQETCS